MNLWQVLHKFYFVCIVKTKVDKAMASVKKGVKYMAIISSRNTYIYIKDKYINKMLFIFKTKMVLHKCAQNFQNIYVLLN